MTEAIGIHVAAWQDDCGTWVARVTHGDVEVVSTSAHKPNTRAAAIGEACRCARDFFMSGFRGRYTRAGAKALGWLEVDTIEKRVSR